MKDGELAGAILFGCALLCALWLGFYSAGCGAGLGPVCLAPEEDPIHANIIGGTPSGDRYATVFVWGSEGFCTGTVVGPHAVLTAAHCGDILYVGLERYSKDYLVSAQERHPEFDFPKHDLSVLYVYDDLPEPYAQIADAPLECVYLLAQGYGLGSGGILQERVVIEGQRAWGIIYGSESTCFGDSGGPLYAFRQDGSYVLVGVTSFGLDEECRGDDNGWVDLTQDGNAAWVKENIQ